METFPRLRQQSATTQLHGQFQSAIPQVFATVVLGLSEGSIEAGEGEA